MFLVWIWSISSLPVASGMPMSTSLSKRPEIMNQDISTRFSYLRCSACSQKSLNINWKHLYKATLEQRDIHKVISPNRLRAGSMLLGLLVAAMTMTWALCFSPSIKVSSWDTMRLSTSPWVWKNTIVTRKNIYSNKNPHSNAKIEHSNFRCAPCSLINCAQDGM